MKLLKTKDISNLTGLSMENLRGICWRKKIPKNQDGKYELSLEAWKSLLLEKHTQNIKITDFYVEQENKPEIIYVTRTTEIYQSKLNFLTFENL